jgi:hypothetical protein
MYRTFLLLIKKAEHLVSIANISNKIIPRKAIKPMKAVATAPPKGDDDLLVLFAEQINTQQASIKQLVSTLSGFKSQFKQLKANYSKSNFNSGLKEKSARCMPTWINDKPSDSNKVKQHQDRAWYWCVKCKQGCGSWSPSHTTDGDTKKGVATHCGKTNSFKYDSTNKSAMMQSTKKKARFAGSTSNMKSMKAAFVVQGTSLKALLKSHHASNDTKQDLLDFIANQNP